MVYHLCSSFYSTVPVLKLLHHCTKLPEHPIPSSLNAAPFDLSALLTLDLLQLRSSLRSVNQRHSGDSWKKIVCTARECYADSQRQIETDVYAIDNTVRHTFLQQTFPSKQHCVSLLLLSMMESMHSKPRNH